MATRYTAKEIGELAKRTRKSLGVTQANLALTSGTGLRFIIDMERGKPTCQLERKECAGFFGGILPEASGFQSFLVMKAWGLRRETMHLGYVHGRNNWEP